MMRSKSANIKAGIAGILAIGIIAITHLVGYRITSTSVTLEEGEGERESPQPTTIVLEDAEKTERGGAQADSGQRPAPRSKPKPEAEPSPAGVQLSDEGRLRIEDLPPGFQQQISEAAEFAEKLPEIEREIRRLNPHLDTVERLREEMRERPSKSQKSELERHANIWSEWRNADPENQSRSMRREVAEQIGAYLLRGAKFFGFYV